MELSDLLNDRRELVVKVAGGELNVVYKPSAFTAAAEEKYLSAIDNRRINGAYAQALSEIISAWDLTQDGEPVPLDVDTLKDLPADFLADVFVAVIQDNRLGGKETRKNFAAGLPQAAKLENARTGGRR